MNQPSWIQEWLRSAQNPTVLAGGGALLLGAGYFVWRVSRRIVQIGFFLFFAAVGFALAAAASKVLNGQLAPIPILGAAGVGFGYFVSAVRSKVMKVVGAATILIVGHSLGSLWLKESAGDHSIRDKWPQLLGRPSSNAVSPRPPAVKSSSKS